MNLNRKRRLTPSQKKTVAGNQNYKCANTIGSEFSKQYDVTCLLWTHPERQGTFGKEGYEVDHIIEFSQGGADTIENCQALCLSCHRVKTINFNQNRNKRKKTSADTAEPADTAIITLDTSDNITVYATSSEEECVENNTFFRRLSNLFSGKKKVTPL